MALAAGTRLGPYEILAAIGEGGMGEVYRATDTKLKRQVAIKVLPATVAADAERLARFQREAEVLAALNHPNIAGIHGLEESSGMTALVMELVEGEDLSEVIARRGRGGGAPRGLAEAERGSASAEAQRSRPARGGGAPRGISIDDALAIAGQIAEALEAAHEQGIIHRDLKPANIKVRDDGTVKVLDFGLAKAMEPVGAAASGVSASMSPTITTPAMTQMGMILGTAAYMAPEQARGKPVDKRADIWAFGCVLYEMLTGHRAFEGDDVSTTLAKVLEREPPLERLPPHLPPRVTLALERCLKKDPRERLRDIGDVRLALDGAFERADSPVAVPASSKAVWRSPLTWLVGAALVVSGGVLGAVIPRG